MAPLQGSVVVTGGLGMIGSLVGAWMARQQVSKVLLLGRSGRPGADAGAVVDLVAGQGSATAFHLLRCDAASAAEVAGAAASAASGCRLQVRELLGGGQFCVSWIQGCPVGMR